MTRNLKAMILVLLLVVFLVGGGLLYQKLAPHAASPTPTPPPGEADALQTPDTMPDPTPSAEPAADQTAPSADTAQDLAPDFTVLNAEGETLSFSSFAGMPSILNFWATWCPPCRSELPHFNEAYLSYGDRINFMMIDLTDGYNETIDGVKAFVDENAFAFPVYFDTEFSAQSAYPSQYIPVTVFIRADGTMMDSVIGAMDEETLQQYIDALLDR